MALAKQYLSIDGEVLMESGTTEKERIMYIRDGMGSVVATADSKGNVLNTYMYKPSGAVWQKTGSAPDPRFLWCGTWGYRASSNSWNSHYVRARHYSHNSGAWTTVDPLWPSEPAYGYVGGRPTRAVDPSGTVTCLGCSKEICALFGDICKLIKQLSKNDWERIAACYKRLGKSTSWNSAACGDLDVECAKKERDRFCDKEGFIVCRHKSFKPFGIGGDVEGYTFRKEIHVNENGACNIQYKDNLPSYGFEVVTPKGNIGYRQNGLPIPIGHPDKVGSNILDLELTFLHEMGHFCIDHGFNRPNDWLCNDVYAWCLYAQLYDLAKKKYKL
ncbi:MAG: hypothetical protein KF743_01410 [Fimbriimonadaceae bacterium]|nr:hypothetical protein [Fimbriimonadaceae bacterium]